MGLKDSVHVKFWFRINLLERFQGKGPWISQDEGGIQLFCGPSTTLKGSLDFCCQYCLYGCTDIYICRLLVKQKR